MAIKNFEKKLTWADFPGDLPEPKPDDLTIDSAKISATWDRTIEKYVPVEKGIKVGPYTVTIFLKPDSGAVVRSILKDKQVSVALLKHEQGHYDIVAMAAREYHDKLAELFSPTLEELKKSEDDLFKKMSKKSDDKDAVYDVRTNHSLNTTAQDAWNKAIESQKKNKKGSIDNLPD